MKKALLIGVIAILIVMGLSGLASAVPEFNPIYEDYLDGKLDGTYSDEELQAYLDDTYTQEYGDPTKVSELNAIVTRMLEGSNGEFPFTGAQLTLIIVGAAALVGVGFGLRRLARSKA